MKEWITYLGEVVLITAVSGLLYHIVPEGTMKKHLHFVISLCVLVALTVPMFSMVMELPGIFEKSFEEVKRNEEIGEGDLEESLIAVSKKEIESAIASYISEVYGISAGQIAVETVLDASDPEAIEIIEIIVTLSGDVQADTGKIRRALHEMFLEKSKITVTEAE